MTLIVIEPPVPAVYVMADVPAPDVIEPPLTVQEYVAPGPAEGTEAALPVEPPHTAESAVIEALGSGFTTRAAALETADPQGLLKSARKFFPLSLRLAVKV